MENPKQTQNENPTYAHLEILAKNSNIQAKLITARWM